MRALRTILGLLTALGAIVAVSFTVNAANPRFFAFLPEPITDVMAAYPWLNWVGSGLVVVTVLANLLLGGIADRRHGGDRA
jgi:hypothetical protein